MRRGFHGPRMPAEQVIEVDPLGGRLFEFRGRRADRVKVDPFAYLKDVLGRVASHPVKQLDRPLPANRTPVSA
jgi:hypothetical protein